METLRHPIRWGHLLKEPLSTRAFRQEPSHQGQLFFDRKLHLAGAKKGSYSDLGYVTDVSALKKSSNVDMFMTAIKIAGGHYIPNRPLGINREAYAIMRNHYAQFGLGVRTGIDLPNESVGFKGVDMSTDGLLLDLSIGQYDTYTPMQLAQYVFDDCKWRKKA
ncbi:penicillin-binding transpeptidase domain-containing protein [Peribacillus frigoritolerans]|nr:penicillin-binding transpeptidase domain-containing protein [Peribacillus frigoritolerans]